MGQGVPPTAIDVAIINWNTAQAALGAARAYLGSEGIETRVTIFDNCSTAEQQRLLEEGLPRGVDLELNAENLGYGTAANRVLHGGSGSLVCVSNADVLPAAGTLAELAKAALEESTPGMVGPVFDGATNRYHAELPGGAAMLGRIFVGSFNTQTAAIPHAGEVVEVGQPSGACFVMRREVWQKLKGFDEGFFLWYEDVDLAKRLHNLGYRNMVVGSAAVEHAGARAFVQIDGRQRQAIRLRSVERYIRLHHPKVAPIASPMLWLSRHVRANGGS